MLDRNTLLPQNLYELVNQRLTSLWVTNMGSDWALGHLLGQDVNNAIKDAWWHKEMLKSVALIIIFEGLNVV